MARIEETMLSSVNFLFNLFIFKVFFQFYRSGDSRCVVLMRTKSLAISSVAR